MLPIIEGWNSLHFLGIAALGLLLIGMFALLTVGGQSQAWDDAETDDAIEQRRPDGTSAHELYATSEFERNCKP